MKTIDKPKYQYIDYPIKEMISFEDMGDGRWRMYCDLGHSQMKKMTRKMWNDLDYQLNKFVEEDGRFEITWRSYDDEYALPMIVFPKTLCNSI